MIRKYHNLSLQTNLWHREEEPQNTNSLKKSRRQLKLTLYALMDSSF